MKPGKLRYKLAEKLSQMTGWLVEAHDIHQNNPMDLHYRDTCRWDCYATIPGKPFKGHLYSWDTMKDCVKFGVTKVNYRRNSDFDIEVCANEI